MINQLRFSNNQICYNLRVNYQAVSFETVGRFHCLFKATDFHIKSADRKMNDMGIIALCTSVLTAGISTWHFFTLQEVYYENIRGKVH